ncbi:PKD domain-containing protein [Halorarius halobius]|uniref:PKD domain-containing protein n=1 Tax=Halorarius halobius TaxID=2962671 RepID=UPI0020CBFE81|nr:PKD domain-containing protein [Halorarius halobius]
MKLFSLDSVVLALVLLGLVVPTGAVTGDELFPDSEPSLVAAPHDGPNGEYATIEEGNLSVDLADAGVNPDATTTVRNVFDLTNEGDAPLLVWITHDAGDRVSVVDADGDGVGSSEDAARLAPGETLTVGFVVDTHGSEAGDDLMDRLTVKVREPGTETPDEPGTATPTETSETATPATDTSANGTGGEPGTGGAETIPTPGAPTPAPSDPAEGVSVQFSVPVENATVAVTDLDELPSEDASLRRPRARIVGTIGARNATAVDGANALVLTNETVSLDGHTSLVGTADAVDERIRVSRIVRIDPPRGTENAPATVRIRVDRDALAGADPTTARVGRATAGGWQLLETQVVDRSDEAVTLAARTPGFSVFAVFASPDVSYTWNIESVGQRRGEIADVSFAEPGIYNASLTVTDALGQSDTASYRILANDRPNVTLDRSGPLVAGSPVTLRANVTDRVGETTVTWRFEDGTTLVGRSVNRSFAPGRHVVEVTVRDEYGANRTREFALDVPAAAGGQSVGVRQEGGAAELLMLGVSLPLAGLLAVVYGRRQYVRRRDRDRVRKRDGPSLPARALDAVDRALPGEPVRGRRR